MVETTAIPITMFEFVMEALEAGKPKEERTFHVYLAQLNYPSIGKLYEDADKDGDGKLDVQEVRKCLLSQRLTTTDRAMKFAMERADLNFDGTLSMKEFQIMTLKQIYPHWEKQVRST